MTEHSEDPESYGDYPRMPAFRRGPKRVKVIVMDDDAKQAFEFMADLASIDVRHETVDVTNRFESPWRELMHTGRSALSIKLDSCGAVAVTVYEPETTVKPKRKKKGKRNARQSRKVAGKPKRKRGKGR